MNNLIVLPTAKLRGVGKLGTLVKGYIARPGITPIRLLEIEKEIVRGTRLPVANDSEFNPAPGAA